MRVFVFDEYTKGHLALLLQRAQLQVIDAEAIRALNGKSDLGFHAMDSIDCIVLEITQPHPDVNYVLAQSILQQKPTLCLYQKNHEPRDLLNYLIKRGTPKSIYVRNYTDSSVSNVIDRFLADISGLPVDREELPTIKFTVRLTAKVDHYLAWKSKRMARSKADILRDWMRLRMDEDQEFRRTQDK